MRVLLDYRPALRERSGVGEFVFQLTRALLAGASAGPKSSGLDLTLFSSSWKDRLERDADLDAAAIVDRHVPVSLLNFLWHRLEWPAVELLSQGAFDIVHSPHPLLLPSRSAARVVTIHDLYFMSHPERSRAEVRRDYPALARDHAQRADQIVVPSQFTALAVQQQLDIAPERISVCPHGRPTWSPRSGAPPDGYVLFFGTLEPRKNVAGLLDAYQRLLEGLGPQRDSSSERGHTGPCASGGRGVPPLVLAGHAPDDAMVWLERIHRPPLQGVVRHLGYIDPSRRRELYAGARLLVQPSFEEGFGLPVLEAMTMGVPVVAANRGALPEVLGGAGLLVDPENPDDIASAIDRMLNDETVAAACTSLGLLRARQFDWPNTARLVHAAYQRAVEHRQCASA